MTDFPDYVFMAAMSALGGAAMVLALIICMVILGWVLAKRKELAHKQEFGDWDDGT